MSRRLAALATAAALAALAAPVLTGAGAEAQTVYLAFGDSITYGVGDDTEPGGYPPRLRTLMRLAGEAGLIVENWGVPGERTSQALSRIDAVLARGGDCLLLMEGTNDINEVARGLISIETVLANLAVMEEKAAAIGTQPVLATLIPRLPDARFDSSNVLTRILTWELRERAFVTGRRLVDNFEAFEPADDPDVFATLYDIDPDDSVGHPNAAGYDRMAQAFADVLLDEDTVHPVPGRNTPAFAFSPIEPSTEIRATLYEPAGASGIDLNETFLVINGKPVAEPTAESTRRKAELVHQGQKALGCRARVSVVSQDLAEIPNTIERVLATFDIVGREVLPGDVDFDCRVDGVDLVGFALAFGSELGDERYDPELDFNADDRIDGEDLAILASNFGKQSR